MPDRTAQPPRIAWPEGRRFAFTIFDDPDSQSFEAGRAVYAFLRDMGLRTTKAVWPIGPTGIPSDDGVTCADAGYVAWLQELARSGFEIAFHNATSHTSPRGDTQRALDRFAQLFGGPPSAMANHYFCHEAIYWGSHRLTGTRRPLYDLVTAGRNRRVSFGHVSGHPYFWGDLCRERIKYVRGFVFPDIDTLKSCPDMPYHDASKGFVNYWFAASEGSNVARFNACLAEANQERLEEEGGACILYTHFGHGFFRDGALDARFRALVERMARRGGWFVPATTLLDHLLGAKSQPAIGDPERRALEWRWLWNKLRHATT